jgi:L-ascorbate metabolism protein UlaG (beta-lactamase superfamily)
MSIKLDWLGCATFRLLIDDLTIFLDTILIKVRRLQMWVYQQPKQIRQILFL